MVATAKGASPSWRARSSSTGQPGRRVGERTIDTTSVDTGQRSATAICAPTTLQRRKYPAATFRSTRVELVDDENAKVTAT